MDPLSYIKMGELYLPLSGMFLFVSIGGLENHIGSWEIVCSKRRIYASLHLFRILFLTLVQMLMFIILLSFIWLYSPYIKPWDYFFGIYIDALFLGILGMFFADISGNYGIGYIVSLGYYAIGTIFKNNGLIQYIQLTGYLYEQILSKYILAALTLLFIILNGIWYCFKQRLIPTLHKRKESKNGNSYRTFI